MLPHGTQAGITFFRALSCGRRRVSSSRASASACCRARTSGATTFPLFSVSSSHRYSELHASCTAYASCQQLSRTTQRSLLCCMRPSSEHATLHSAACNGCLPPSRSSSNLDVKALRASRLPVGLELQPTCSKVFPSSAVLFGVLNRQGDF